MSDLFIVFTTLSKHYTSAPQYVESKITVFNANVWEIILVKLRYEQSITNSQNESANPSS